MSKAKTKSGIKVLAADAKARLKNGFYKNFAPSPRGYQDLVKCSLVGDNGEEKAFYEKVKRILQEGEVINPLTRLVNQEYIKTLDYGARQRYLLEISEKFKTAKEKILSET
jgi:hypothetical protein